MEQELITLGILFAFALAGGILAARFKQPMLLGLLIVGALIGPHMLGLIKNEEMITMMIDFGAILMLFIIGLEFELTKLKKIGLKAIIVGLLKSGIVVFIGFSVGLLLELGVQTSLFIGIILAFSSTVVIVKVLESKDMMSRQEVPLLIAVLIVEDILAVIILTFFSGIQDKSIGMITAIQNLLISIGILAIVYYAFIKIVKPILTRILKDNKGEEILVFTALAMCAGFAYLAYYLKLSPAAGAFLAGSIMAALPEAKLFEKAMQPYNLMISSFFFIAVGTLVNFASIKLNIMIILVLVLTVIITRIFAFGLIVYLFANFKGDKMFFSSMAMFSIGEFALLIAQQSKNFQTGIDLISISAAIVFITAVLMSLTLKYSDRLYGPTKDNIPFKLRQKIDKFSDYIRAISDEIDLDNKYSRGLRQHFSKMMISGLITLLLIFGWRKISPYITESYSILVYITILVLLALTGIYLIFEIKKIMKALSDIFENATNIRNEIHSKQVVRRAFIGFGLFWTALTWPFFMFIIELNPMFVLLSYGLLTLAFWQFHKISLSMEENLGIIKDKYTIYTKIKYNDHQVDTSTFNRGWKF